MREFVDSVGVSVAADAARVGVGGIIGCLQGAFEAPAKAAVAQRSLSVADGAGGGGGSRLAGRAAALAHAAARLSRRRRRRGQRLPRGRRRGVAGRERHEALNLAVTMADDGMRECECVCVYCVLCGCVTYVCVCACVCVVWA